MNTDTQTSAGPICPNCEQWQHPDKAKGYHDCLNDCAEKGFAPKVDRTYKRTIPAGKPTANSCPTCGAFPVILKRPTPQDHIRDLHDAATRFEDRAKRAEAQAAQLAEALRDCITSPGALAERSHEYALRRLKTITDTASEALAAYESEVRS